MLHYIILLDFQSVFALQIKKHFVFLYFVRRFGSHLKDFGPWSLVLFHSMGVQIYISAYVSEDNAKILEVKQMKSVLDYEPSLKKGRTV